MVDTSTTKRIGRRLEHEDRGYHSPVDVGISSAAKRRELQPRSRGVHDGDIEGGTTKGIFENPSVLQERALKAQHKKERAEATKGPLEELFDGDEIDDQFATKQDKAIAEKDIPERLTIKVAE